MRYQQIFNTWYDPLNKAHCIELLDNILPNLDILYENTTVFPIKSQVFRAFEQPYDKVKVILLGQDPYHSAHGGYPDACGLSFLTENGFYPPSLRNLFKELQTDDLGQFQELRKGAVKKSTIENYDFQQWVNQGVMMLNTALTVEQGLPESHINIWQLWSQRLVYYLALNRKDIVWILLGKKAKDMLKNYDVRKVEASHPSPLARGFLGSKIYSRTNELLEKPIIW